MNILEGKLIARELRLGIVIGRFNEFIGSKLLDGAISAAVRHGVDKEDITVAWVPGAFEIPLVAKQMINSGIYDSVVCLGGCYQR